MEKVLSAEAARVLGVLIEKELSTPDYYPMTLNSLVNGCNQKSNRFPVVEYGEFEVLDYLDELQRYRLVGHASVAGSRSEKFRHATAQQFGLEVPELALLASLCYAARRRWVSLEPMQPAWRLLIQLMRSLLVWTGSWLGKSRSLCPSGACQDKKGSGLHTCSAVKWPWTM